jgi:putative transposase
VQANKLTLERHTGRRPWSSHDGVHCARTSAGALITSSPPVVMARSCVCCLLSMPSRSHGLAGHVRRHLRRDGARADGRLRRGRFGISKAAHPVEWLSDNGSAYIAKDKLDTATALGLKLCFTPVRSPASNRIAEAFVKTFKHDYARLSVLPDAQTAIALLRAWLEDYNEVHPHSGLKFLPPREFPRLSA